LKKLIFVLEKEREEKMLEIEREKMRNIEKKIKKKEEV